MNRYLAWVTLLAFVLSVPVWGMTPTGTAEKGQIKLTAQTKPGSTMGMPSTSGPGMKAPGVHKMKVHMKMKRHHRVMVRKHRRMARHMKRQVRKQVRLHRRMALRHNRRMARVCRQYFRHQRFAIRRHARLARLARLHRMALLHRAALRRQAMAQCVPAVPNPNIGINPNMTPSTVPSGTGTS